ncbi:MAG: hypothetical protein COV76_02205 [Candidatus Omnitrophica bacterium CG11_big_fil_rev_8_21_14_0_20_64_10]|nr:MAG: hypothetical protein COV76_02205 [Candidatus Omnitrophica bacterium CG11_big_fil_rev_8_21_14_0_20_64_10]
MFGLFGGSKKYEYQNTRQYLRLPAAWPIKCEVLSQTNGRELSKTRDVSAGGVRVRVRQPIPVGTTVRISIVVQELNRTIEAEAQVVRSLPGGRNGSELGIRFIRIDPGDQRALRELIESKLPEKERARQLQPRWRRKIA